MRRYPVLALLFLKEARLATPHNMKRGFIVKVEGFFLTNQHNGSHFNAPSIQKDTIDIKGPKHLIFANRNPSIAMPVSSD
jgi:hypothetical protein